jgi:nitrate/TMAO reductase-like tetraheme cytochrome c subunit
MERLYSDNNTIYQGRIVANTDAWDKTNVGLCFANYQEFCCLVGSDRAYFFLNIQIVDPLKFL